MVVHGRDCPCNNTENIYVQESIEPLQHNQHTERDSQKRMYSDCHELIEVSVSDDMAHREEQMLAEVHIEELANGAHVRVCRDTHCGAS